MRYNTGRLAGVASVAGMAAGALILAGVPAWAGDSNSSDPAACYVQGLEPSSGSGLVWGDAVRQGCSDNVRLEAWIYKDVSFLPDPQIGYGDKWLVNGRVKGQGKCEDNALYYVT